MESETKSAKRNRMVDFVHMMRQPQVREKLREKRGDEQRNHSNRGARESMYRGCARRAASVAARGGLRRRAVSRARLTRRRDGIVKIIRIAYALLIVDGAIDIICDGALGGACERDWEAQRRQ